MKTITITAIAAGLTLAGVSIQKGESVELPEASAAALVKEGKATAAGDEAKEPAGGQKPEATAAEEIERQRKALDDQYTLDELKTAAKDAAVDFAYDATKKALIASIIEQGKTEALLK